MSDPGTTLPVVVRQLLERLDSIAQLEMLLLLAATAPEEWSAAQIATRLRIEPGWAAEQLGILRARELLTESRESPGHHRFDPATPALAKAVEALADSYADHRVSIVALLYSRPVDRIRVFSDAFRIRREDDDG
jgi:hypothetical protein